MNYEPNFEDPRVRKRVHRALTWADLHLLPWRSAEASSETLHGVFGSQTNPLTKYLRAKLLVEGPGGYRVNQYSKRWYLNQNGRDEIGQKMGETVCKNANGLQAVLFATSSSWPMHAHGKELTALSFQYEDKADRLWHPLQNIRRENKGAFWSSFGLPYDYDFVACAPTILFQLAVRAGVNKIVLEGLQSYLDDRSAFRQHVAELTGLCLNDSKKLVNSLFNGAKLGANPRWAAFKLLDFDEQRMHALSTDPEVRKLRASIARVWRGIEFSQRAASIPTFEQTLAGYKQPDWKLTRAKDKWALYFRFERDVLNAVTSYLQKTANRHFTEHDGFRTEFEVDVPELEAWIEERTSLKMTLERA